MAALSLESGTDGVLKLRVSPGLRVLKVRACVGEAGWCSTVALTRCFPSLQYMGNFSEHADSEADLAGCDADKSLVLTLVSCRGVCRCGPLLPANPCTDALHY